jgi:hypothetical protein
MSDHKRNNFDSRRQAPVVVQFVNFRLDLRNHVGGLLGAPSCTTIAPTTSLCGRGPECRASAGSRRDLPDILHQHRDAVDSWVRTTFSMSPTL